MKKFALILTIIMLTAINVYPDSTRIKTPIGYSSIPSYIDLYQIKEYDLDDTSRIIDSTYNHFQSIPLDTGTFISIYNDTTYLPGGILISDRIAALYVFYKAGWERQQKELKSINIAFREFHSSAREIEHYYQEEIVSLRASLREAQKRTWLEENKGYIGFAAGLITAILVSYSIQ